MMAKKVISKLESLGYSNIVYKINRYNEECKKWKNAMEQERKNYSCLAEFASNRYRNLYIVAIHEAHGFLKALVELGIITDRERMYLYAWLTV